jgi:hypothetical protein
MSIKKRAGRIFFDKIEMLAILFFIFGVFLLDVQLNMISAYGQDVKVPFFGGKLLSAMSLFWLGMLVACFSFLLFSIRALYRRKSIKKLDLIFSIMGGVGLAIVFAGGLLIYAGADNLIIPFFTKQITRIDFYHSGLVLDFISLIYFSLTK